MTTISETRTPEPVLAPEASAPAAPPDRAALGRLLRPIRGRLAAAVVCQVVSSLAGILPFLAVAELGRELLGADPDPARALQIAWAAAAALLVRLVFMAAAGAITHFADNDLQLDIRRRLADHLGRVPLGWFTDRNSGAVKKALQDDVGAMHHLVGHSLTDLAAAVVTPLASLAYLFWADWRMALVALLPVVVGLALYGRMMSGHGETMAGYTAALGQVNASAVEFVEGISVVKTFGQSGRAHERFRTAADAYADRFISWVRPMARVSSASEVALSPVTVLLTILVGGAVGVSLGVVAPLDVLPAALLGTGLTGPLLTLGYSATDVSLARAAAGRVTALLDRPPLPEAAAPAALRGSRVEFDGVRFSYDGRTDALAGVDLVLEPGTVTALVGRSGSGKSTLAKLLPRFADVDDGAIRLGGVDLRDIPSTQLYRQVGFVLQDVAMLRTSVRDNIRLGRPGASQEEVEAAARAAQVHDRIVELPHGYDAVVGQDARFSGGEAQRVSIARALLADAPILVLDEATGSRTRSRRRRSRTRCPTSSPVGR